MNNGSKETAVEKKIFLGWGILGWPKSEKLTGRYGIILLSEPTGSGQPARLENTSKIKGIAGKVIAEVIETRKTTYLGDLHKGLFPKTPEIGEEIELGRGFLEANTKTAIISLHPTESRRKQLFDPEALHKAYDQTVILYFIKD